jgi:hypothetical protein
MSERLISVNFIVKPGNFRGPREKMNENEVSHNIGLHSYRGNLSCNPVV